MAVTSGQKSYKWIYIWAAITAAVVVVWLVAAVATQGARIVGDTPQARIACICRVADEGISGAGDAIAEAATKDPDASVRRAALLALARFVEPKHRPMLESAAGEDDADIRSAAATTLGEYSDAAAADRLGELAAKDSDEQVRIAAVDGLDRCAAGKALVHLVETMEKNGNPKVQQYARSATFRRVRMPARITRPQDLAMWRNDLELVKGLPVVIAAYKAAGVTLIHHPEYIIPEPGE